ncbi:MAG: hypothetical protein AB1515_10010 [Nitrospirota bacterium]
MRKSIVAAVGLLVGLTALPLYAAEVTFSGEFRVRAFASENILDGDSSTDIVGGLYGNDKTRFNDLRFRLRTAIKAGVTSGIVVLDFGNCFAGADVATYNGAAAAVPGLSQTGDCRFGQAGLGRSFNVVGVREAHLNIDLNPVTAVLGRQSLKLGHGIVFDDTSDAITLIYNAGPTTTITGSLLQVADAGDALGVPGLGNDHDTSIWVLNVGMDHDNHVINIYNALLYDQGAAAAGNVGNFIYPTGVVVAVPLALGPVDKLWQNFLGISLDAKNGPMTLAAEGSYAVGRYGIPGTGDHRLGGWNLMGDATVDTGGAAVGGTVVYASGQDPSATTEINATDIAGNFQLGNILLNNEMTSDRDGGSLGGGFGGAGILAAKLHASTMPSDKLTVGGALIYARTAERVCQACEREIGWEVDANAAYRVDDNLTVSAGAGYLLTGDGAEDFYRAAPAGPGGDNHIWKLAGRAVFTF